MCLYPKLILNKRYCSTKKNKGVIPPCPDERLRYVTAAGAQGMGAGIASGHEMGIKQEGVDISREQVENYAQDIANRLHLGEKGLDIQEQKLIIDCITGLLNIAVQGGLTPMGKIGSIVKKGK